MTALVLIAVSLLAVSLWWISRPLRRAPAAPVAVERAELVIVRDRLLAQLRELDAERADQGIESAVARDEELRLSTELAEVLKRLETFPEPVSGDTLGPPSRFFPAGMTALLAVFVVLVGGGLYVWQNAANLQGFVLAARGGTVPSNVPPMVLEMVARLEKRLAEQPDDAAGWARLGRSYVVLQQTGKARAAYARAHALAPDDVEILSDYAWLEFNANPGRTTGLVHTLYTRLSRLAPDHPDALWFLGLAAYQNGDPRTALRVWERLASRLPAGSPELTELNKAMQTARDELAGRQRR
jgi:cytochrome c-type biogenesis protein CcmH